MTSFQFLFAHMLSQKSLLRLFSTVSSKKRLILNITLVILLYFANIQLLKFTVYLSIS